MLVILSAGIAPGLALLSYFYLRDEYDAEPITLVFKTFMYGALITFPIMFLQYVLEVEGIIDSNWSTAFISSGLLEEFFKWFILMFAIFQHVDFNEPYDGIIYGASVSLGFATIENILYLVANGVEHAFGRAILPVSSHALFGVIMGYYLGKAKFSSSEERHKWLFIAISVPLLLHGTYNYIFLAEKNWIYYMVPFMFFLWWLGLKKVKSAHRLTEKKYTGTDFEKEII
ncbi:MULTISPECIES: glutamic-type intramembrane protease PrsW [Rossellomorea]|jgi:protease PrsW|uniref:Protease PrsW n=1 Tax=Rossellomorea aquimaris TaxID=189382 RepID=A0A5D4UJF9_9BACI|nr:MULTISPECIES: glutamic-type intramembrane protease PrsW [Rossellomorea]MDT9024688.1 glutamic-type intramembrane protease PrsW [Rossellomorea sp. YC4-1]TYS77429.1 intramembrane metalloprotease PrsW [Rossellomorea aquimaris]TYS86610.1 intramembrane metalloprotease PrsW [Rossellomorea aquimaris]TYS87393.1 intramembrane metalloprotease PrsW [Rossellomorea aquimaris]